jgi:hypothetical protein
MREELNNPELVIGKATSELRSYFDSCKSGSYADGIVLSSVRDLEATVHFRERMAKIYTSNFD